MERPSIAYLLSLAGILCFHLPVDGASLQSHELYSLMLASQGRYISIEATLEVKGYYPVEENPQTPLMYLQEMIYRQSGEQVYVEAVTKTFSQTRPQHFKETMLLTSKDTKYFRENLLGNRENKHGVIQKNRELSGWISYTPEVVLWHDLRTPIRMTTLSNIIANHPQAVAVQFDTASQNYILNVSIWIGEDSPRYRFRIDPSKDYMATVEEFYRDNNLEKKSICGDYRQVNGFWTPFRYWEYWNNSLTTDVAIKSLSINQFIGTERFVLEFPTGTTVRNEILGVTYVVGREKSETAKRELSRQKDDVVPVSGENVPPETDKELAEAALQAEELLGQLKQGSSGKTEIVPIDVVPSYVWVLPGKSEYVLSIRSEGEALSLVQHTFGPAGLVMHELEDRIAAEGKIRVTLERPAEQTTFADGVLTLEFAGQTRTVHFVAAPAFP